MLRIVTVLLAAVMMSAGLAPAKAEIVVTVDKSAQRLTVNVNGYTRYQWPVSTARWGYRTPNGSYRPERLERQWYSRKYDWSPMPHSIFFSGGYAIHGSYEISRLGRPASHGCIRLHPQNAATLFALVSANVGNTRIVVTGEQSGSELVARSRSQPVYRQVRSVYRQDRPVYHADRPVYREDRPVYREARPVYREVRRRSRNFEEVFEAPSNGFVAENRRSGRNWEYR